MTQKYPACEHGAETLFLVIKQMLLLLAATVAGYTIWCMGHKVAAATTWVAGAADYLASWITWMMSVTAVVKIVDYLGPMLHTVEPLVALATPALTLMPMQGAMPIIKSLPGGQVVTATISVCMAVVTLCSRSTAHISAIP